MSAGYQLSRTAEDELEEILLYVAEQSGVDRALLVHGSFVEAFEQLAEVPGSGSKRTEMTGDRVRWWRVFDWVVLYDWESSPLTILRVLHGARDLDRLLNPDPSAS
ncbi:type II toxin-antitoxin system RelE/ParE family toxin [Candidatus Palauibacter sp.]|uniref:type II toxin-antitoxin system RelE/ParE family toxin n=1 Tax=Candidatus Palauibacter sp. TaxID=3101350 RepID=UPI003AF28DFF